MHRYIEQKKFILSIFSNQRPPQKPTTPTLLRLNAFTSLRFNALHTYVSTHARNYNFMQIVNSLFRYLYIWSFGHLVICPVFRDDVR